METARIDSIYNSQRVFFNNRNCADPRFRKEQLKRLLEAINKHKDEIYDALKSDLNKSYNESFIAEVGFVFSELNHAIKKIDEWVKPKKVRDTLFSFPSKSHIIAEPYGLTLIIAPWNYPFQLIISPLIGAMAAGNCVILKPSPEAPNVSAVINKMISECFTVDYIAVIEGGHDINQYILKKRFDYIFFTGSPSFGKYVMQQAAENLTPVTLELGGKSPWSVDEDVVVDLAAKRSVWGKSLNAGQTSIAPDSSSVNNRHKERDIVRLMFGG